MGRYRKMIGAILILICGGTVLLGATANAYVLSGPHVLELMIARYGKAKRLRVSQTRLVPSPDDPTADIELSETVQYVFPASFRSDLRFLNGERIEVVTQNDSLTAIDGRLVHTPPGDFDCYKDILLYHSREVLQEKLIRLGVNVSYSSLGRFEDKIAYVLGAQYPDESRPQVWVEKEHFRPIRWLLKKRTPSGEPVGLEIQYHHWQLFAGNWYPLQISFFEDGRRTCTIKVERVEVNPAYSARLFDIDRLKRVLLPALPDAAPPPAMEGIGAIGKTIEESKPVPEEESKPISEEESKPISE